MEIVCRHVAFQVINFALLVPIHLLLTIHVVFQIVDLALLHGILFVQIVNFALLAPVHLLLAIHVVFQIGDILTLLFIDFVIVADRSPLRIIFLLKAVDLALLHGILFVQIVDFTLLAPVHLLLAIHVVFQIGDILTLLFIDFVIVADRSPLRIIFLLKAVNLTVLFFVPLLAHFDGRVLLFIPVRHAVQTSILRCAAQIIGRHVLLQTGHSVFQIRHVAFQPGYILLIVFQLINLIILPFFVVKRVKIFSICGCIIPIPRPRRSSSYLCTAQGEQDAAGEEGGEDGPFQRAAGPFLFTSAPPPYGCCE